MNDIKDILSELGSQEWYMRNRVFEVLLNYPEDMYLDYMEEALRNHDNDILRNAAMEFYMRLGQRAIKSLLKLVVDKDHEVRIFAANLLGEIKAGEAVLPLIERLTDEDVNVRMAAAEALGKIGDPSAVTALGKAINDEPWVAMAAIRSLGEIGGNKALDILYKTLEITDYRGITFEAIEKAGDAQALTYLTPFVDKDELREFALKAIAHIAEKEDVRIESEYFLSLMPVLIQLQQSPNYDIRKASLTALSWTGDVRAIQSLLKALEDEELQDYAISGILNIGKKAMPEIIAALRDRERKYRNILVRIMLLFDEFLPLMQFYNDEDPEVRAEVAIALGKIRTVESRTILMKLTEDPEEEVRLAAEMSLNIMGTFNT